MFVVGSLIPCHTDHNSTHASDISLLLQTYVRTYMKTKNLYRGKVLLVHFCSLELLDMCKQPFQSCLEKGRNAGSSTLSLSDT